MAGPLQADSATRDSTLQDAIQIVETIANGSTAAAEAKDLEKHPGNVTEALDVLSKAEESMSVNDAIHNGGLITRNKVNNVTGERPMESKNCGSDGVPCFQGDEKVASKEQLLQLESAWTGQYVAAGKPWAGAVVKYCFASDVTAKVKHLWDVAMKQVSRAVPCISFQDVGNSGGWGSSSGTTSCDASPAVFVQSKANDGCWSYVGETGSTAQGLQLEEPGCDTLGTTIHELGHTLGMAHEQARPDRGHYVTVHWQNIRPDEANNFDISQGGYTSNAYDYLSIMHYDTDSFAVDSSRPTLTTSNGQWDSYIGQDVGLSQSDADQLAAMYKAVDPQCASNSVDSSAKGCDDVVGYSCAGISQCDVQADYTNCCGCGGGLTFQCWSGAACPSPAPLPKVDHRSLCVNDQTASYSGYACVAENTCNYDIEVKCASAPNSFWVFSGASGSILPPYGTDVCTPGQCTYMKVAAAPVPTPAPTLAPTPAPTPLPPTSAPTCGVVDYTHLFAGYQCVVKNTCSYAIVVRCPAYPSYYWTFSGPSGYKLPPWNDVCTPGVCSFQHQP